MQNIAMDGRNVTSNHILLYPHTHFRRSTRTTSTSTTYITTYHQQHPPPCPPPCPPPPSPTHQPHHSRHWSSKASGEKTLPFLMAAPAPRRGDRITKKKSKRPPPLTAPLRRLSSRFYQRSRPMAGLLFWITSQVNNYSSEKPNYDKVVRYSKVLLLILS